MASKSLLTVELCNLDKCRVNAVWLWNEIDWQSSKLRRHYNSPAMETGQQIKEARILKGMTQQELARLAKTNVRTIQRIENGDVTARSYTLRMIASALELDPALLIGIDSGEQGVIKENRWLVIMLHLSGFLLLPTIMIWLFEKDRIRDIREHGVDVINFQLTMLVFLVPVLPLGGIPVLIALFTSAVILINTFKVIYNRPYHYPITISFLKA